MKCRFCKTEVTIANGQFRHGKVETQNAPRPYCEDWINAQVEADRKLSIERQRIAKEFRDEAIIDE